MSRRLRKLLYGLGVTALVGGTVWAWYGSSRTHTRETPGRDTKTSAPRAKARPSSIEPIQMHLIPRRQPTPMSPFYEPSRSPK
jgi:hypothetical protein